MLASNQSIKATQKDPNILEFPTIEDEFSEEVENNFGYNFKQFGISEKKPKK